MPILITDIIIPISEQPYEEDIEEEKELDSYCSLCKEKLELVRANDWKPVEHTLDECLKTIFNKIDNNTDIKW